MAWPPRVTKVGTTDLLYRFGRDTGPIARMPLPFIKPGHKNPAIEQLPSSTEGVVTVDGSGVTVQSDNCRIFTGSYTGDGAISQVITCPGAGSSSTIRYLRIWQREASTGTAIHIWESTREIFDDAVAGMGVQPSYQASGVSNTGMSYVQSNTIIDMGTDGTFTVDDGGSDYHPNKNSIVYNFMALGS
jgi:hypothetical protein